MTGGSFAQSQTWDWFAPLKDHVTDNSFQFFPSGFGWYTYKYMGYNKQLMYTNDGGITWFEKDYPFTGSYSDVLKQIFFADSLNGYARFQKTYGSSNTYKLMTTKDGGLTWYMQNDSPKFPDFTGGNGKELGIDLLKFLNAKVMYGYAMGKDSLGNIGKIPYMSVDSGKTFVDLYNAIFQNSGNFGVTDIEFASEQVGYALAYGRDGNYVDLMKTKDGGSSWTKMYSDLDIVELEVISEDILYIQNYNLYKSTDGGATFTDMKFLDNTFYFYKDSGWGKEIDIPFVSNMYFWDKDNGLVTFRANSAGPSYFLARTSDGGVTWTQDDIERSLFDISSTYPTDQISVTAANKYYGMFRSKIITNSTDSSFKATSAPNSVKPGISLRDVRIYPNPVNEKITIMLPKNKLANRCLVQIISTTGEILYEHNLSQQLSGIRVDNLNYKGFVLVKISNIDSNQFYTKKLIIN